MAFKNEYTLDPAGARAAAGIAQTIAIANGIKDATRDEFVERTVWLTHEEIADNHLKAALAAWPIEEP